MSFNSEANIVRDMTSPIGLKYVSLRHCVERFCPLGFGETWAFLSAKTGLKENEQNSAETLVAAIEILSEWRRLTIEKRTAEQLYLNGLVRLGVSDAAL